MARNPRQAALYEVINRSRFRDAQLKALERIGAKPKFQVKPQVPAEQKVTEVKPEPEVAQEPVKTEDIKTEPVVIPETVVRTEEPVETVTVAVEPIIAAPIKTEVAKEPVKTEKKSPKPESTWTTRPKPVRIFPDRIELCLSWQIAGLSVLALAAIFLVFFRFGQMSRSTKTETKPQAPATIRVDDIKPKTPVVVAPAPAAAETKAPKMVEPMGENAIVITNYDLQSHLEPVKAYFAQFGIATEIIKQSRSSRYLLVTQNRYDNIEKAGTEGNEMKKKIMSIGAKYKPPVGSGFETFGTKPFQDVYGLKIK
jgi:hypothetical protein